MPLVDVFWNHVDLRISSEPQGRIELERRLKRLGRGRDKNAYTNWFNARPSGSRPNIRLSDLEDVATALDVPPSSLVAPVTGDVPSSAIQLELPFGSAVNRISLEMEATDSAVKLRIMRSR